MIQAGDEVVFTGHGYRRAITYKYAELFGTITHEVKEIRQSCCNRFLILKDIEGMYAEVFFERATKETE